MAPELLGDIACADASVDIYAMSKVMWFVRTGRDPVGRTLGGHNAERDAGAGCLGWGAAGLVVARAWAKEAAAMPSAEAIAEALEAEAGRRTRTECRLS